MSSKIKPGEEFIGIGFVGPLSQGSTGEFIYEAGKGLVASAIRAIFSTQRRHKTLATFIAPERFMRDDFGSNLKLLKHENVDENSIDLLESLLIDAVERWEPRAEVTGIESKILDDGESIQSDLSWRLKGTDQQDNLTIIRNAQGKLIFKSLGE